MSQMYKKNQKSLAHLLTFLNAFALFLFENSTVNAVLKIKCIILCGCPIYDILSTVLRSIHPLHCLPLYTVNASFQHLIVVVTNTKKASYMSWKYTVSIYLYFNVLVVSLSEVTSVFKLCLWRLSEV